MTRLTDAELRIRQLEERVEKLSVSAQLTRLADIESLFIKLAQRLENHSLYTANTVTPQLEQIQEALTKLWVSDDKFKELERAVADIAIVVYNQKVGKKKADSRVRHLRKH